MDNVNNFTGGVYLDDMSSLFFGQNGRYLFFRKKTGRHVNFCRNENFLTSFRIDETGNLISDLLISGVPKIEHRQFSTFPCNKKPGLKLDDS